MERERGEVCRLSGKKKFFSLQYKFLIYFLILSILPSGLTAWFSYEQSSRAILRKTSQVNQKTLESVASNLESIFAHVNEVSHTILQNEGVREFAYGNGRATKEETVKFLLPFVGYNSVIQSVFLYTDRGDFLAINTEGTGVFQNEELMAQVDRRDGGYLWTDHPAGSDSDQQVFSFVRQYRDIYKITNKLGYIVINVSKESIHDTYYNASNNAGNIFLLTDRTGRVMLSNHPEFPEGRLQVETIPSLRRHGELTEPVFPQDWPMEEYAAIFYRVGGLDGYLFHLIPVREVLRENRAIAKIITYIVLANVVVCVLLAWFISTHQLAPLRTLTQLIKDVQRQNFNAYLGKTHNDEIGILAEEFNQMSQELETLINKVYATQLLQKEAELKALQAQINPHFLYNTLDTIYWVCRLEHAPDSAELVRALGDLFRLSLNRGNTMTAVEQEVRHLKSYLAIQTKKTGDRVAVVLAVEPDLLGAATVNLVLQPLVENAFLHGVARKKEGARVRVAIRAEEDRLLFLVEDNGAGIPAERLARLLDGEPADGIGLKNVQEKLRLIHGEPYGLTIESVPGEGTRVTATQPLAWEGKEGGGV